MPNPRPRLIGLPYDASSSFLRGAAAAPALIRAALRSPAGNDWTETGHDLGAPDLLSDAGDLDLPATADAREMIVEGVQKVIEHGFRPLSLGGDHSVTYAILRAVNTRNPKPTILHIDAHADLYDEYEGDRYSHACPFARIMEAGLASRLVQVGIRTLNGHQREQATRFGVEMIEMGAWAAGKRPVVEGPVYISVDIDGIDPAHAPGVSHREPGGLTVRDVLSMIHAITGDVIGADVVEFNPAQDVGGMTAQVAAKIVKELAGKMLGEPKS